VILPESNTTILANASARSVGLDRRDDPGNAGGSYAEMGGVRVEAQDLVQSLSAAAAAPEGVEFAWIVPGRSYQFRAYRRTLPPADGHGSLAVLTCLDLTEQRAIEGELRRALEVRDEFFSIATHELKDPLFALQLSNQLLWHTATRQGEIPAHVLRHLEVGRRQTERLCRLVDNLLDVSRIMNRRLQLDIEALDLSELVREVAGRFREQAEGDGTPIEAEASSPVIGYFDRLKLEQILSNLLSNALKYGGGRPISVRLDADDETAVIAVEDQGPGIAVEDQGRIFARFERASAGHRKESLGLGLYIVRSLVEAHGGFIGVRSELGRGATFIVKLPRKRLASESGPAAGHVPGFE
jgi:signal transduction histidine kinase